MRTARRSAGADSFRTASGEFISERAARVFSTSARRPSPDAASNCAIFAGPMPRSAVAIPCGRVEHAAQRAETRRAARARGRRRLAGHARTQRRARISSASDSDAGAAVRAAARADARFSAICSQSQRRATRGRRKRRYAGVDELGAAVSGAALAMRWRDLPYIECPPLQVRGAHGRARGPHVAYNRRFAHWHPDSLPHASSASAAHA